MSEAAHSRERERDARLVQNEKNTARYFTENPHVSWVALVFTILWGLLAYIQMPKAKDPIIEVRVAVASCSWPGAEAEKVEDLITRRLEQRLAENANIEKVESTSRTGLSIVYVTLREAVSDRSKEWNDIEGRLNTIHDLPQGAGPIVLQKDFGDTATLMLTVASPTVTEVELDLRARAVEHAIRAVRVGSRESEARAALIVSFPPEINAESMQRLGDDAKRYFEHLPGTHDARPLQHPAFLGIDVATTLDDAALRERLHTFANEHFRLSELHPDVWFPAVVRKPEEARQQLLAVAGQRYSYRDLDLFTELIQRRLQRLPSVSKVGRSGILPEQIYLEYSQERLASYGIESAKLSSLIAARNITASGGVLEAGDKNVTIDPSGELRSAKEIGDIAVPTGSPGAPLYLRDLVSIRRDYQSPARFLNLFYERDASGKFAPSRAVTLAVNMRAGEQIDKFATEVGNELKLAARLLPEGVVIRRTSDQPRQVSENVGLFMKSLYEAVALVVLVALIGFWEWRTALLLALAIPITLAMTFGLMQLFGVDIQQISIASLIIALGLLVDDPVVASDAIKHSLAAGWKPKVAAWLGPTKLAVAIMFATVTNIVSYLPFLTLSGDAGKFIHSLPVVLTLSLIASRIVSMTFVPLLGSLLLRPSNAPAETNVQRREKGFGRFYYRVVGFAVDHRRVIFPVLVAALFGAFSLTRGLRQAFFPKDLSYLSYVDVWLPEDATWSATREKAREAERIIVDTAEAFAGKRKTAKESHALKSVTAFIGGGGPRFWFSVSPELPQPNYAQLIVEVEDKEDTSELVPLLQERLSRGIAGARVDVRQLETGKPVGIPVAVRISGESITELRSLATRAKEIFRGTSGATRVRDDWGADAFSVDLKIDSDRANAAGVTNLDVARSSAVALNGATVGQLREADRQIGIVVRLRASERESLADIENLYVTPESGTQKVPLGQVSRIAYSFKTEKMRRRNQTRTITVAAFPTDGYLSSEVMRAAASKLDALKRTLPPGYTLEIGGEAEEQAKSFKEMALVALLLIVAIYAALVVQFKNAVKPLVVFAALPFGVAAALLSLLVTGAPVGFMALLGIISLMGVIVSHIIVLFDCIEELRAEGEPMREALLDAGLLRLRPVVITVVATVLGLIPLAIHGGPLWEPLCYAQIGGLTFATIVTLAIVPLLYTLFVSDLRWIRWDSKSVGRSETGRHDAEGDVSS